MSARGSSLPMLALLALLAACVAPQPPPRPASAAVVAEARTLAQPAQDWATHCTDWDDWDKRAPAFRVHGNTYHVGTCGITALLVAGPQGHVLFDTGTRRGAVIVLENIRKLGFAPENVGLVATSHEHFDHVGGLWWVHQNSGARIVTSPQAAPVLISGTPAMADPQAGVVESMRPLDRALVRAIEPGQPLRHAGLAFLPVATPGHTPGALSWQWESCEEETGACLTIVYADSLSPVSAPGYRFSDFPDYVAAYRAGLDRLAALECDILLTPHPSASGMREKLLAGDMTSGPNCREYAAAMGARLDERLAEERAPEQAPEQAPNPETAP